MTMGAATAEGDESLPSDGGPSSSPSNTRGIDYQRAFNRLCHLVPLTEGKADDALRTAHTGYGKTQQKVLSFLANYRDVDPETAAACLPWWPSSLLSSCAFSTVPVPGRQPRPGFSRGSTAATSSA